MHLEQNKSICREIRSSGGFGLLAALALSAGLALPGAAWAGELFQAASGAQVSFARANAPGEFDSTRQSFVTLNRVELAAHMAPLNMDRAPERARQARGLDGTIEMTLGSDVAVALQRNGVDRVRGGGVFWSADVLGADGGVSSFLIERGQIFGRVQTGGKVYKIEPIADTLHRITEIDPAQIPSDIEVPVPAADGAAGEVAPGVTVAKATNITKVKYLVAYTTKAKNASADIEQEIKFAIAWSNQAFKNSGVKVRFKLVKTMEVKSYDEDSTTYGGNLSDLKSGAAFAGVRKKRNKFKADLVSLIREGGSFCGIGYVIGTPTSSTSEWGFSVTSRGTCIPATFPHEAGHNMGLFHDRFVEAPATKSDYNFGYVNVKTRAQTVMSYSDKCDAAGVFCTDIPYFSTPKKKYNGQKIGKPQGKNGAADAARLLNENRAGIASYR